MGSIRESLGHYLQDLSEGDRKKQENWKRQIEKAEQERDRQREIEYQRSRENQKFLESTGVIDALKEAAGVMRERWEDVNVSILDWTSEPAEAVLNWGLTSTKDRKGIESWRWNSVKATVGRDWRDKYTLRINGKKVLNPADSEEMEEVVVSAVQSPRVVKFANDYDSFNRDPYKEFSPTISNRGRRTQIEIGNPRGR